MLAKFDTDVLSFYTYSQLVKVQDQLRMLVKMHRAMKEHAREFGSLMDAVEHEKVLIVAKENLKSVAYIMAKKEEALFEFGGIESFCLN